MVVKRWQDMLAQYPLTADQRATFDPLLKVELNPCVATLIAHAEARAASRSNTGQSYGLDS